MENTEQGFKQELNWDKLIPQVFLFLFVLIPFLPRFGALDAMGFHWMCFAFLNVMTSFYLINKNRLAALPFQFKPFLFYVGWIGLSALSILFAYNPIESLVVLARILIVLAGFYNFYCIAQQDKIIVPYLLNLLLIALIVESVYTCWMLYYNFNQYKTVDDIIYFIKFYSGNKNILAASIAVKIPIVLWLIHKEENRSRLIAYFTLLFIAVAATIILNARATYITVFLQSLLFICYEAICYFKTNRSKLILQKTIFFFVLIITCVFSMQLVFSQIEKSKKTVAYGDLSKRIESIEFSKSGSSSRFEYWEEALKFIKENPLVGGGLGNWKIHAINYEQTYRTSFVCSKHVHNDFLEVAADSGIVSAIVFAGIFFFLGLWLLKITLTVNDARSPIAFMLLLMLVAFLIDSCLNFPSERPIMQGLWILILVMSANLFLENKTQKISINHPFSLALLLMICFSMYVSINSYYSMCLQAKVRANTAKMSEVKSFPAIPNISEYVMPINGIQANYFYTKRDYKKALEYLNKKGNTNPYYYYTEYVKSRILFAQHDTMNAIKYASIAFENRPADLNMFNNLAYFHQTKKDTASISKLYQTMTKYVDYPKAADSYASYYLKASNDTNFVKQFLATKIQEFPNDTILKKTLKKLQ